MQVLVYHDLLGMMQHPHHAKVTPKFCKQYASLGIQIEQALGAFNQEVKSSTFPSATHTPYKIAGEHSCLSHMLVCTNDYQTVPIRAVGIIGRRQLQILMVMQIRR